MDNPGRATLPGFRATIELPIGMEPVAQWYPASIHVTLTKRQGMMLRRLREGLQDADATLDNGRPVRDWTKTIRWLLEKLADQAEAKADIK
jgi:hypothetical protein